ncbi:MAG: Gfo/Idh/MocA family oxidoreductase [Solirubrobacterales bacterium]
MLSLGVIGLGEISPYYLAAIEQSADIRLRAACDKDPDRLGPAVKMGADTTTDYRDLLALDDLDAVVVNTPNHLHADICLAAVSAGRHVCCEKPLVPSHIGAQELKAVADQADKALFTAFHRRYNRNVRDLAEWLQGGARGSGGVRRCRVRYLERIEDHCGGDGWYLDPASCGGGCLMDNGPNALDVACLLVGDCEVTAARIESRDGIDVRAAIDLSAGETEVRVELDWAYGHGELKDVRLDFADGSSATADMLAGFPAFKSSLYHEYAGVLDDFARVVVDPVSNSGKMDLSVVKLVEDGYRLAREVDKVVIDAN